MNFVETTSQSLQIDQNKPLSYTEWLKYNLDDVGTILDFSEYVKYLKSWQDNALTQNDSSKLLYKNLLRDIYLVYSNKDEQRFLKNIDFNNPQECEIAVPFVLKKLEDIASYYKKQRDVLKLKTVQYQNIGTKTNIKQAISELIYDFVRNNEADCLTKLEHIRTNLNIRIDEFYDMYQYYFDYDLKESNTNDIKNTYSVDVQNTEYKVFTDEYNAILDEIRKYPIIINEIENEPLTFKLKTEDRSFLEKEDTIDLDDSNTIDANLSVKLKTDFITQFIGTDVYALTVNDDLTYSIQLVAKAKNAFDNRLNTILPTVSIIPSDSNEKNEKQIGEFFKPSKQGLLFYNSINHTYEIDKERLIQGTTYYFPNPEQIGNIRGCRRGEQVDVPISFISNTSNLKYFNDAGIRTGEVKSNSNDVLMMGYASKEQTYFKTPETISDNYENFNTILSTGQINFYTENIEGDAIAKLGKNKYDYFYPNFITHKTDYKKLSYTNYYLFNQDGYFDSLNLSAETDYNTPQLIQDGTLFGYTLTGLTMMPTDWLFVTESDSDIVDGFLLDTETSVEDYLPTSWDITQPIVTVSYGSFLPDDFPNERKYYRWMLYDGGVFTDDTDTFATTDQIGFPVDNTFYAFSILLEGGTIPLNAVPAESLSSVKWSRGGRTLPFIDNTLSYDYQPDSFIGFENVNNMLTLEGGFINDVENPYDITISYEKNYSDNIDPSAYTTIIPFTNTSEMQTINERADSESEFIIKNSVDNLVYLSTQMADVFSRYGAYTSEFNTSIKNLNVYNDLYVIETPSCIAIEQLEKYDDVNYKPKRLPYLIVKNQQADYQETFFSQVYNSIIIQSIEKIGDGVNQAVVPSIIQIDVDTLLSSNIYDGYSQNNLSTCYLSSTWDSSLSGVVALSSYINIDFTSMSNVFQMENQSLNQLVVNTTLYDVNDIAYMFHMRTKYEIGITNLVEFGIIMPKAHTITLMDIDKFDYSQVTISPDSLIDENSGEITLNLLTSIMQVSKVQDATEGGASGTFRVSQSLSTDTATNVYFTLTGCTQGVDYQQLQSNYVTIPAGQTTADITITAIDEEDDDGNKTLTITLDTPLQGQRYELSENYQQNMTIIQDETDANAILTVSKISDSYEGGSNGVFRITQHKTLPVDQTIYFNLTGCTQGVDYQQIQNNVTLSAGQTTVDVTITAINEDVVDADQTLNISLDQPLVGQRYELGSPSTQSMTIFQDATDVYTMNITTISDATEGGSNGVFRITQSKQAINNMRVNFTVGGTAQVTTDYVGANPQDVTALSQHYTTIPSGSNYIDVTIQAVQELLMDSNKTLILTLAAPTTPGLYEIGNNSQATMNIIQDNVDVAFVYEFTEPGIENTITELNTRIISINEFTSITGITQIT